MRKVIYVVGFIVALYTVFMWGFNHLVVNDTLREYPHIDHRLVYPQPEDNSVIVVHGDISNTGTCSFTVFYNGQTVENLGSGTFKIFRLSGTPDEVEVQINEHYTWMNGRPCTRI